MADFHLFYDHGSLFLLTPRTQQAEEWCYEHLPEDAPTLGKSYAIEHRYIEAIVSGIRDDGLTVDVE